MAILFSVAVGRRPFAKMHVDSEANPASDQVYPKPVLRLVTWQVRWVTSSDGHKDISCCPSGSQLALATGSGDLQQ